MPVTVEGKTYYRTAEACRVIGISRNTLFKWLGAANSDEAEYRDWRGWRLIPGSMVKKMKQKTHNSLIKSKDPNNGRGV